MSINKDDYHLMKESNAVNSLKLYLVFLLMKLKLYGIIELKHSS